mgnify:FL=1
MTILVIITVIIIAASIVFWYRHRTRRIMENLNRMLDIAIQGNFTEEHFDESMLSSVENKLANYLAASTNSAKNVQAEKDKIKTLIADISHQTKTPIANILLYTQLLREQSLPEESQPCVDSLESQSRKLQSLIDALVKTSRLESGIIALRPSVGNLASVIQSAVSQLAPKAEEKGISIVAESKDADAVFDSKWTEEAIFNLLDNAVKYTPSGGEVRISVTSYELFSAVHISDTGPGIPEEEQPKVFQRFYRGMEHQNEEGVGIGLYLVRQIAEGQGGYVKVISEKGMGSTFSLYLPRN